MSDLCTCCSFASGVAHSCQGCLLVCLPPPHPSFLAAAILAAAFLSFLCCSVYYVWQGRLHNGLRLGQQVGALPA